MTIHDTIESLRRIGVPEQEIVAKVVELLGDVTPEEVRAVLADASLDHRYLDTVREERLVCSQIARFALDRDEELARDIRQAIVFYIEQAIPEYPDHDSDLRRQGRRLDDMRHAIGYHLGEEPKTRL